MGRTMHPSTVARWARVATLALAPATFAVPVVWMLPWWLALNDYPTITLMVFMLLALATSGSGAVWFLARCHVAIHQAFTAGVMTGLDMRQPARKRAKPELRAVE